MQVDIAANTDGTSGSTDEQRYVDIKKIDFGFQSTTLFPDDPFNGELRAHFDPYGFIPGSWNVEGFGHIHGDKLWLREFKAGMRAAGFSIKAVRDMKYSDIVRQTESYVCLDVGPIFYASYKRLTKPRKAPKNFTYLKDL